jgi:hypothetical protein
MVGIAITRAALGQERPPGALLLYFAAGPTEWRMFSANVRYLLGAGALLALAALITVIAFKLSGTPLDPPGPIHPTAAAILAGLIAWAVFLYAGATILRIGFLLPSTIVRDEKGGLRRSYELAKGNFWRILAVLLALGLPILLLLLGGEIAVLRSALGPDFARMDPTEFFQKAGEAMDAKLLPWQAFSAMIFILASGLIYSGAAFAYQTIAASDRPPRADEMRQRD